MVNEKTKRAVSACLALLVAFAAVGGAVSLAEQRGIDASPVGETEAGAVTTAVVVGTLAVGTTKTLCEAGYICDSPSAEDLAEADALETKKSIHQSALTQEQNNLNFLTQVDNELEDTKTIARLEAKNQYIKSLNNGTAEAVARAEAREAVADYYSVRQKMLLNQWELSLQRGDSMAYTAQNTSNMGITFAKTIQYQLGNSDSIKDSAYLGTEQTVQLANGTTQSVDAWYTRVQKSASAYDYYVTPQSGEIRFDFNGADTVVSGVQVQAPNNNYETVQYLDFSEWKNRWDAIQQQNNQVQNEVDDFVNATYAQYQQGQIDNEDLIDPYLQAREYDPQNSSSWALRSALSMGINPPANTGEIDTMTVQSGGDERTGLLLTPGDLNISTGTTYDTANLSGQQYVWDPETGDMSEITGEFSVSQITGPDGESKDSATYRDTDYKTTNITEFQQKMERLNNLTAQINARQQRLRQSGGGGTGGILEGLGVPPVQAIGLAALFVLILGIVTRS
jgi:hypothetical protein